MFLSEGAAEYIRFYRFLLAELHLNSLVNQDNRRRLRRALQSLPEEVNRTYDETMLRIESQDRQKVERAILDKYCRTAIYCPRNAMRACIGARRY